MWYRFTKTSENVKSTEIIYISDKYTDKESLEHILKETSDYFITKFGGSLDSDTKVTYEQCIPTTEELRKLSDEINNSINSLKDRLYNLRKESLFIYRELKKAMMREN